MTTEYIYQVVELFPGEPGYTQFRDIVHFDTLPSAEEVKGVLDKHDILFSSYAIVLRPLPHRDRNQ